MTEPRVRESDGPVADAVRAMYAAYPDPARFDKYLHQQITIWETDQPGPPIGLAELAALRDRRRSGAGPRRPTLSVEALLVDRWGSTAAVARYLLRAVTADGETTFRVSDIWDVVGGRWQIVHHHAEQVRVAAADSGREDPHSSVKSTLEGRHQKCWASDSANCACVTE